MLNNTATLGLRHDMRINLDKSAFMYLGARSLKTDLVFKNMEVEVVHIVKILGIWVDSRLNFLAQVQACKSYWNGRLYLLRSITKLGASFATSLEIAYSFRSKLTFGLHWWNNLSKTSVDDLERLWRKAIRTIARIHFSSPLENFLTAMSIPTLAQFITYLYTKVRFDWWKRGIIDVYSQRCERMNNFTRKTANRYRLRTSTIKKTDDSSSELLR